MRALDGQPGRLNHAVASDSANIRSEQLGRCKIGGFRSPTIPLCAIAWTVLKSSFVAFRRILNPMIVRLSDAIQFVFNSRTSRAGLPATTVKGGTSRVTTERAPTTAPSPIETPLRIVAPKPIQDLSPIATRATLTSAQCFRPSSQLVTSSRRQAQSIAWESWSTIVTPHDMSTSLPIIISLLQTR